ncbi:MAG TPA: aminopeptidase [Planctomycetes bacterium]|nr:aminopeptidase [Planctomycetota bacterium]
MMKRIPLLAMAFLVLGAPLFSQDGPKTTPDGRFTLEIEVPRFGVINQDATGTCWSFGTTSFLESEVGRMTGEKVNLSEMYTVRGAYIEKTKRFLKMKGKNTYGQGGLCHDVIDVIRKYGAVPADVYTGLCNGRRRHNHTEMESLLAGMAKALVARRRVSPLWPQALEKVMDVYIGEAPESFDWNGKTYSPKSFSDEVLKLPYDSYVEVMSFATEPFYKRAALDVPDNWMHYDRYVNVPVDDMMAAMDHALGKGFSVAVDMDVSEPGFAPMKGTAQLPAKLESGKITDELRKEQFLNKQTTDDHLMHIVGVARDKDGKVWYLTKNSWGPVGPYKGYVMMSRPYVALKMLSFMAHKDGLPKGFLGKIKDS